MRMFKVPHPGVTVKRDCIEALGLSVTAAAKRLSVTRESLSKILNGRGGISPEMAVRLEKAFGGRAETWLKWQMTYDLAQVKRDKIKVRPVKRTEIALQPD